MPDRVRQEEPAWRRSKKCDGGACVEVGTGLDEVMIRSSSDSTGITIVAGSEAWREFLAEVKSGLFDPTV